MGARVPVQHYGIQSAESYIGSSLHDLNNADASPPTAAGDLEGISDVDRDAATEDSLGNGDETNSVDCLQESYRHSMPLIAVDENHSGLEISDQPSRSYGILTADDILPIETSRARFLEIVVDNFIKDHVIEVENPEEDAFEFSHDKFNKRKQKDIRYEGDPRFVLPLMYVANLYEALVCEVNMRLASLDGIREKTIGVSLEAAGGLYRKLARKFPRKVGLYSYKRRELATSLETRTRFPELVVQEEKRVRFVVVNGLEIIERPTDMSLEDAEWFKCLTGRHEVNISSRDYKFYSPRHKYRRASSSSVLSNPSLPQSQPQQSSSNHSIQSISHQSEFQSLHQTQQTIHQNEPPIQYSRMHQCQQGSSLSNISGSPHHSTIPQHMTCIQNLSGGSVGGRVHILPTSPAKFCDQCGTPYLRETSKFCSECGTKRLGI